MNANSLLAHFAGNTVRFSIEGDELRKALSFHFKHCIRKDEENPVLADYEVKALENGKFSASQNGELFFSALNFRAALWQLTQDAITQLNGAASKELVFHAAALSYQEDAAILCGKSGSGKSSLATWLVAEGLGYLTDEVISRPLGEQIIRGLSRSLVLKAGSAFIWQHWLADADPQSLLRFSDNSVWIEPTALNPEAIKNSATPRLLIFPRYAPDVEAGLRTKRLSVADALFHLLQNLVNARNFDDHGFAETSRLAQQAVAHEIIFSDIEKASAWIKQKLITG